MLSEGVKNTAEKIPFFEENPWLKGKPAGVCFVWMLFYQFVNNYSEPKGVVKAHTSYYWGRVLGVYPEAFTGMVKYAISAKKMRYRKKSDTYIIPEIASPKNLGESTMRMRKHRAKKQGVEPGSKPDQPVFTVKYAQVVVDALAHKANGRKMPKALAGCIVRACILLWDNGRKNPMDWLEAQTRDYVATIHPIDWLNRVVGKKIGRQVELTRTDP